MSQSAASKFCAKHCEDKDVSIKKCYRNKALSLHPDRNVGKSAEILKQNEDAFKEMGIYDDITDDDKARTCSAFPPPPPSAPSGPAPRSTQNSAPRFTQNSAPRSAQNRPTELGPSLLEQIWTTIWSVSAKKELPQAKKQLMQYIPILLMIFLLITIAANFNNNGGDSIEYRKSTTAPRARFGGAKSKKNIRKSKSKKQTSNKNARITRKLINQSGGGGTSAIVLLMMILIIITNMSTLAVGLEASIENAGSNRELELTGQQVFKIASTPANQNITIFNPKTMMWDGDTETTNAMVQVDNIYKAGFNQNVLVSFLAQVKNFFIGSETIPITPIVEEYCAYTTDPKKRALCDTKTLYLDIDFLTSQFTKTISESSKDLNDLSDRKDYDYANRNYVRGLKKAMETYSSSMKQIGPTKFEINIGALSEVDDTMQKIFAAQSEKAAIRCSDSTASDTGLYTAESIRGEYNEFKSLNENWMGSIAGNPSDKAANLLECNVANVVKYSSRTSRAIYKMLSEILNERDPNKRLNLFMTNRQTILMNLASIRGRVRSVTEMITDPKTMQSVTDVITMIDDKNWIAGKIQNLSKGIGESVKAAGVPFVNEITSGIGDIANNAIMESVQMFMGVGKLVLPPNTPNAVVLGTSLAIFFGILFTFLNVATRVVALGGNAYDAAVGPSQERQRGIQNDKIEGELKLENARNERLKTLTDILKDNPNNPALITAIAGLLANAAGGNQPQQYALPQPQYAVPPQYALPPPQYALPPQYAPQQPQQYALPPPQYAVPQQYAPQPLPVGTGQLLLGPTGPQLRRGPSAQQALAEAQTLPAANINPGAGGRARRRTKNVYKNKRARKTRKVRRTRK